MVQEQLGASDALIVQAADQRLAPQRPGDQRRQWAFSFRLESAGKRQIVDGDIIRTIREHHRWFCHYHTAGNPGRGQPVASQELNYPAIYRAIAATGYAGMVSHEFLPTGDPLEALARAFNDASV